VAGAGIAVLRVARLAGMAHLTRHVTGLRLLRLLRARMQLEPPGIEPGA
jgi:hypothetical protein